MIKKKYKALMLDLDGTTVSNNLNGMPSEKVIDAIFNASQKLSVGIVSGRTPFWAKPIIKKLSLNAPSIVSGGAQILDGKTGKVIWEKVIEEESLVAIEKILKEQKFPYIIPKRTHHKIFSPKYYKLSQRTDITNIAIMDLSPHNANGLKTELNKIPKIAIEKIVGWKVGTNWLQISHAAATKQYGIIQVAKILGIETHEIIGVGDGYNDFPLLMACGLKVAMGNAVSELKAIADYIAPTVDEDGVADVIEKFIL
jgi:Cof subfamily protein (haloacid dehalogenase superfamily)